MTESGWLFLALLATVVLLSAACGFIYDYRRRRAPRRPVLLTADQQRAQATVNYYIHVQDSSD